MKQFFTLLFLLLSFQLFAQNEAKKSSLFVFAQGDYGYVMPTNVFVTGDNHKNKNINSFAHYGIGVGWQTAGKKDWQHLFNFPSYGLSLSRLTTNYHDEMGQPMVLAAFFEAPFKRWEKSSLEYHIAAGIAMGWNKYDSISNNKNMITGAGNTMYIGLGARYHYWMSKQWELTAGVMLTHFSNGAIRRPNRGLNLLSPSIGVRYHLEEKPEFLRREVEKHKTNDELALSVGYGRKTGDRVRYDLFKDPNVNFMYNAAAFNAAYMRQYSHRSKSGLGASLLYDEWLGSEIVQTGENEFRSRLGNAGDRFSVNLFAAHEFCIDKLSIYAQLGYYIWQATPEKPSRFNQRLGIKYHLQNNLFASISVLAHDFTLADYIEWGIGYRIKM
jgi:hypothetical protein